MKATHDIKVLGKFFHAGEEVPDIGSIGYSKSGGLEGLLEDEAKLDNITWMANGEECLLSNGSQTIVKHFIDGAWVKL